MRMSVPTQRSLNFPGFARHLIALNGLLTVPYSPPLNNREKLRLNFGLSMEIKLTVRFRKDLAPLVYGGLGSQAAVQQLITRPTALGRKADVQKSGAHNIGPVILVLHLSRPGIVYLQPLDVTHS